MELVGLHRLLIIFDVMNVPFVVAYEGQLFHLDCEALIDPQEVGIAVDEDDEPASGFWVYEVTPTLDPTKPKNGTEHWSFRGGMWRSLTPAEWSKLQQDKIEEFFSC